MKYSSKTIAADKFILANDHYVAIPYNCGSITAADGIIKAGTIVPANDATAVGVLLSDVVKAEDPNGTIVIHGFVRKDKLPASPDSTAKTALAQITFLD